MVAEQVEPGIYRGMPAAEYFETPGLSSSAMRDLAVSPLRYWHLHLNPQRPAPRTSPEMQFGSALHCAVLEPDAFEDRYCKEVDADEYVGLLDTVDQMRAFIESKGGKPKGTKKADMIAQVRAIDPDVPILAELEKWHKDANIDKVELSLYDWRRVKNAANALLREPQIQRILSEEGGTAEASIFRVCPDTGVLLKGRLDWITAHTILDLKTFSVPRGKSVDEAVSAAIFYEKYHRQARFYSHLTDDAFPVVMAFVESEEPHEVRIREFRPKAGGEPNLYWMRAGIEVREMIRLYDNCQIQFGDEPWRVDRDVDPLADSDLPQFAWA